MPRESKPPLPDRLLNRVQIRDFITIADETVDRWVQQGRFPKPVKIGRFLFWRWSQLEEWLAKQK